MILKLAPFLTALALTFLMTSCDAMNSSVAERCVLIDVHGEDAKEIVFLLDSFAKANDLSVDKSHPISPSYERREGDTVYADVMYTMGIGRFGAELALFRFDNERASDVVLAFDEFVERELAPRYAVTRCTDVPDYQLPKIYR